MNPDIDNFLRKNIKCFNCGEGPAGFSITYDYNDNLVSKYGEFCSVGCYMNFYNYSNSERSKMRKSRSNTPNWLNIYKIYKNKI